MTDRLNRRDFLKHAAGWGAVLAGGFGPPAARSGSAAPTRIASAAGDDAGRCARKAVDLLGGMSRFVASGSRVALLPNAQSRHPGSFTNPGLIQAAVRMCREAGAAKVDALSWLPENFWQASGLDKALEAAGAGLVISGREDELFTEVPLPRGRTLKAARIMKALADYDVLIDMPIVKDHAGNKFTGTMKNLMGLNAPSCNRTFHLDNWETDPAALSHLDQCIADLNLAVTPDLCLVDVMEIITTNGPFGPGKLAQPKRIVAGTDRVAIDAYCTSFLGLTPGDVIMIGRAAALGLGEMDLSKVQVLEGRA